MPNQRQGPAGLRVGVDASVFCGPITGIGWYARQVLGEMARLEPGNSWLLYASKPIVVSFDMEQIRLRFVPPKLPIPGFFWRQMTIPRLAVADGLDCFWGPAHLLPVGLPSTVPAVVTVHDLVNIRYPELMSRYNAFLHRLFFRRSLDRADAIIAVSASARNDLVDLMGCNRSEITVVHHGVGTEFKPLPSEMVCERLGQLELKPGYLLAVGTLEPRKNHALLFRALARLPHLPMLVIAGGRGWRYQNTIREVSRLNLQSRVRFLGYVPDADLPVIMNGARLLVFPSLYEGFGFPVIQAMACGVPVLTSDGSSLPEVGGDAAAYFQSNSLESLCDALTRLIDRDSELQRMKARGLEWARQFSWERAARSTLAVLHSTADKAAEAGTSVTETK
jgi:glycosyltransferase involved in cell wall biosynthesis